MKKAPTDQGCGAFEANEQRNNSNPLAFPGSSNPRHLRALHALLRRPMPREELDREAGASNGPALISDLRERGLELPCSRVPCYDRDGKEVKRGIYHLSGRDRRAVAAWLRGKGPR